MLVDSHCHLDRIDLAPFEGQLGRALDAALKAGVEHFLCVGTDLETWPAMMAMIAHEPRVSASMGVHPNAQTARLPTVAELVRLARHPRVVAVGETGLDYYYGKERREIQQSCFRLQIAAAREVGKPLIVHTREAKVDTLRILKEERADVVGGVLHCFSEDWEMAAQAMALNFHISFSGIVTFKSAHQLREVVKRMPAERMLVETDCPYLAPVPHRGKSNQPAWVRHVAECIASVRGESLGQVAEATTANYFRLFAADAP